MRKLKTVYFLLFLGSHNQEGWCKRDIYVTCNGGNKKMLQNQGEKHFRNTGAVDTMIPNWLIQSWI